MTPLPFLATVLGDLLVIISPVVRFPVRRAQRRVFYRALMTPFLLLPDSTWQLRSNRSLVAPEPHLQRG